MTRLVVAGDSCGCLVSAFCVLTPHSVRGPSVCVLSLPSKNQVGPIGFFCNFLGSLTIVPFQTVERRLSWSKSLDFLWTASHRAAVEVDKYDPILWRNSYRLKISRDVGSFIKELTVSYLSRQYMIYSCRAAYCPFRPPCPWGHPTQKHFDWTRTVCSPC